MCHYFAHLLDVYLRVEVQSDYAITVVGGVSKLIQQELVSICSKIKSNSRQQARSRRKQRSRLQIFIEFSIVVLGEVSVEPCDLIASR